MNDDEKDSLAHLSFLRDPNMLTLMCRLVWAKRDSIALCAKPTPYM